MHNYLLTCSLWLEALVKHEVSKQGGNITEVQDKAVYFEGEIEMIARMNIWSRFGNILYYVVAEQERVTDFDTYFDIVFAQDWEKYIPKWYEIVVRATAIKSELGALSPLQALCKKAIVKKLSWDEVLWEDKEKWTLEVSIVIVEDTLKIMINTSGDGLHKRGYREMTGDAPLKENIAAALVILSGWKFREPLYDIFCGSGTIGIEAAMIARNIAPWLKRHFAFENWRWVSHDMFVAEKTAAIEKEFSGEYKIYCTDIRKDIIELWKRNAKFAGVDDTITFGVQDYTTYMRREISGYLVSNPPYGLRLEEIDVPEMHRNIAAFIAKNSELQGWIITAHAEFESYANTRYKKRKLYNGWEMCYFYKKL